MNIKSEKEDKIVNQEIILEINKLKVTSYDIRAEIQRLNQILQRVETKIQENLQSLNSMNDESE